MKSLNGNEALLFLPSSLLFKANFLSKVCSTFTQCFYRSMQIVFLMRRGMCWIWFFFQLSSVFRRCGTGRCLIFRCDIASQPSGTVQWAISFSHLFILYLEGFFSGWWRLVLVPACGNPPSEKRRLNIQTPRNNCFKRITTTETVGATQGNMYHVWFPALFFHWKDLLDRWHKSVNATGMCFMFLTILARKTLIMTSSYFFTSTNFNPDNYFAVTCWSTGGGYFAGWLAGWQEYKKKTFLWNLSPTQSFERVNTQIHLENIESSDFDVYKTTFARRRRHINIPDVLYQQTRFFF